MFINIYSFKQIKDLEHSFIAIDDSEIGQGIGYLVFYIEKQIKILNNIN